MRPDETQVAADHRADDLRERDRQREPHRHPRCVVPARQAAHAPDTSIIRLRCPSCTWSIYVPTDSHRERVSCISCMTQLVTVRADDGTIDLEIDDGGAPCPGT